MNGTRTDRRLKWFVLASLLFGSPLLADQPAAPPVPTGEARLSSGRTVRYAVHYDRNALRDSVRLDDGLIALTTAGTLLRFELPDVRFSREHIGDAAVVCIGRGEAGSVLVGLADGQICRVDPHSLALTELARVPSAPQWVGWSRAIGQRPAGLVVVARGTRAVEYEGKRSEAPCSVVHDLAAGKVYPTDDKANAFLLDRAGRLWLGADHGEWAGSVTRLRLDGGRVDRIAPVPSPDAHSFWEGVYGFVELRDGQVWAFGGTSHMFFNSGEIVRIDEGVARSLYQFKPHRPPEPRAKPDPNQPRMPFTHIVEEKDELLVFSYSDVFRVDRTLKDWKRTATVEIRYRWGRPDAMGAYPAIASVLAPPRAGAPYLLATIADGFVLLDGPKTTSRAVPGQLGGFDVADLENSSEGTLVFEDEDQLPWKLGPEGWEIAAVAPAFEPDPAAGDVADPEKADGGWHQTRVLIDPAGTVYTVSGTSGSNGTRTTARWANGKAERLGREVSTILPSEAFITGDGSLWTTSGDGLVRFQNGRWKFVGDEIASIGHLKCVNEGGPPWVLLARAAGELWRLELGGDRGPTLRQVKLQDSGKPLAVHDAIPWSDGTLLLATDRGLRDLNGKTFALSPSQVSGPHFAPTALARDRLGRVWFGTAKGVWLGVPGAKSVESFEGVPWIGRAEFHALVPDPHRPNGVIASLGARGVAFVWVEEPR